MDEVSRALPDLVWLTELSVTGDVMTLKGKTLSPNAVATYLENLKKSPFFAEPVFKNLGREAGPQGIYNWEMTVIFTNGRPPGEAGATAANPKGGPPGKTTPGKPGK
jgi:Tfp pilus assembly protein PilN